MGLITPVSALVQMMAWCRTGDKLLSESMMAYFTGEYIRYSAAMI